MFQHRTIILFRPIHVLVIFVVFIFFQSCKKDKINSDGSMKAVFSTDTLKFDTLFVTLGSTTKYFTLKNETDNILQVKDLKLKSGSNSFYRVNIDGDELTPGMQVQIPPNDSIYVFVEVTIDPNADALPFVIEDALQMNTNGNTQEVVLQAYGQNAHFYDGVEIETEVWDDDLPYVILNSLLVKEGHSLIIHEGVEVYFGGNSGLFVQGSLSVEGSCTQRVEFRCLRRDKLETGTPYYDLPGQWLGVFFLRKSISNSIENLYLRGSQYGINVGNTTFEDFPSLPSYPPDVSIKNTEIYNSSFYGIFGFNGIIDAENIVISQCGKQAVSLVLGGDYSFTNSTFFVRATNTIEHKDPLLYFSNFHVYDITKPPLQFPLTQCDFVNCIFYGSKDEEILPDDIETAGVDFNYSFTNCLIKTKLDIIGLPFTNCFLNKDPGFVDVYKNDLKLDSGSVCIDAGTSGSFTDITCKPRTAIADIGAYEY